MKASHSTIEVDELCLRVSVDADADARQRAQVGRQRCGAHSIEAKIDSLALAVVTLTASARFTVPRDDLDLGRREVVGRAEHQLDRAPIDARGFDLLRVVSVSEQRVELACSALVDLAPRVVQPQLLGSSAVDGSDFDRRQRDESRVLGWTSRRARAATDSWLRRISGSGRGRRLRHSAVQDRADDADAGEGNGESASSTNHRAECSGQSSADAPISGIGEAVLPVREIVTEDGI